MAISTVWPLELRPLQRTTLVYCGQTVGWINMKLCTQVDLGPGHIVSDETQLPPPAKRHSPPQFVAHICCDQIAGWIKMPLGSEIGHDPSNIVLDGDPAPLPRKGGTAPNFRQMSIVAKRLDGSRCHLLWT